MVQRNCLQVGLALLLTLTVADDVAAQSCFGQLAVAKVMDNVDALILAKATSKRKELEVVEVLIQPKRATVKPGTKIARDAEQRKLDGKLFVMFGTLEDDGTFSWSAASTSMVAWEYVKKVPRTNQPADQRLAYFLRHLQSDDSIILADAGMELFGATNEDLAQLARQTSGDDLRHGVANSKRPEHAALYGLLLGMKGNTADAKLLEQKVMETVKEFRPSIHLMMAGYLLLSGEDGLTQLEDKMFKDETSSFADAYGALQALQYMRQYGKDRIPLDRLRASVRILLNRSDIADLAIRELTQLKDWSAQDQLIELYSKDGFDERTIKRAIIVFTFAAAEDTAAGTPLSVDVPAYVTRARQFLEDLENRDPKTLNDAKRFRKVVLQK